MRVVQLVLVVGISMHCFDMTFVDFQRNIDTFQNRTNCIGCARCSGEDGLIFNIEISMVDAVHDVWDFLFWSG